MYFPKELQILIINFVYICEICDKIMLKKNENYQIMNEDKNVEDDPFIYWDAYDGKEHKICNSCYLKEIRANSKS